MKFTHACFGSKLIISTREEIDVTSTIETCFSIVDEFEEKYSRFKSGNFLSNLNTTKTAIIDEEFYTLMKLCLQVSEVTKGYFDITILPLLENLGYGIFEERLEENYGYKNVMLKEDSIELLNGVSVELGAVGKGYMVDTLYKILDPVLENYVIDFGGDIRVKGQEEIEIEDPADDTQMLGIITINNRSIASSAGNKRKFGKSHHLINIDTKESQNDKTALYVTHKFASVADIFSTALFVTPMNESLKILKNTPDLEGLIIGVDGKIYRSKGFNASLNIK